MRASKGFVLAHLICIWMDLNSVSENYAKGTRKKKKTTSFSDKLRIHFCLSQICLFRCPGRDASAAILSRTPSTTVRELPCPFRDYLTESKLQRAP